MTESMRRSIQKHTAKLQEEAKASERIRAAAPELLAACKLALKAFEENWCIDWEEIRRAIAKAEGR